MNANELRIDNYVDCNGKYIQIDAEDLFNNWVIDYKPIPLTPEILEKIKFEKHFCDEFFIKTNMSGVLIGKRPNGVKYLRHIEYLHQLQNLFFALTGEELTINLSEPASLSA